MEMQRLDSAIDIPTYKSVEVEPEVAGSRYPEQRAAANIPEAHESDDHQPLSIKTQAPTQSRLLSLPVELQLLIWEYAVIDSEPLYVNGPCDSSFGGWNDDYYHDKELWENGTKKPPQQPPLTRVSRIIRIDALPMFYKHNRFQSGYCFETDMDMTVKWLRGIGEENRKLMRHFFFFDANWQHDDNRPSDFKRVERGPVVKEMGGVLQSSWSEEGCRHEVLFGRRADGEELDGLQSLFGETIL